MRKVENCVNNNNTMLLALLALLLTLILVIGIHEAGHALIARFFHIKINRIALGFGKPLITWKHDNGVEIVLGMWPLGGYVHLANTRIRPVPLHDEPLCFDKKPIWNRVVVLLGGALANLVVAYCSFIGAYSIGLTYRTPIIQSVIDNSIAAKAGLKNQDTIISVAGQKTHSWQEVGKQLIIAFGASHIVVQAKHPNSSTSYQAILDLRAVHFTKNNHSLLGAVGIQPNPLAPKHILRAQSFTDALSRSWHTILDLCSFFITVLKQLFLGVIPFSILLGPMGLLSVSVTSLANGAAVFLLFIGTLSVAVALVNLFPIPGLDGGGILYAIIEKIRKKPISIAMEILLYQLVKIAVIIFLVQLLNNDVMHYFAKMS